MQKPSVGRIVHYGHINQSFESPQLEGLAAIITHVEDTIPPMVNLTVFHKDGRPMPATDVTRSEELCEGHWSWPPRVE